VTVGLATHWPCVTDFVVYPPTSYIKMSILPKLTNEHGTPGTMQYLFNVTLNITRGQLTDDFNCRWCNSSLVVLAAKVRLVSSEL